MLAYHSQTLARLAQDATGPYTCDLSSSEVEEEDQNSRLFLAPQPVKVGDQPGLQVIQSLRPHYITQTQCIYVGFFSDGRVILSCPRLPS